MGRLKISETFIYRHRYYIGYGLIAIILITMFVLAGLFAPSGISSQEMQSAVKSSSVNLYDFKSLEIINLPYHLLQKASMSLLGVSIFTIKLPSIILALFSAIGIIILLRRWYKPGIGVLASLIAITTGQFIFIAQDGTPGILYVFWSICLLLFADLIARQKKFRMLYKISFCILAGLSLYTPLSLYMIIALIVAVFLHPHLRFIIKQLSKPQIIVSLIFAFILIIPLIAAVIISPKLILTLLGIPTTWPNWATNFATLGAEYFGFSKPGGATLMTPFFELGSMILIVFGALYNIRTRAAAKSYVIAFWTISLIPFIILDPSLTSITFVPLVLLLASGIRTLLARWYILFPRNPYARIGGLVPVTILVIVLVFSGADRYINGYRYDPSIAPNFSNDLKLIPKDVKNVVVANNEFDFYQVVAKYNKKFIVTLTPTTDTFLATRNAKQNIADYQISRIITSQKSNQSDRFYLYKKIVK